MMNITRSFILNGSGEKRNGYKRFLQVDTDPDLGKESVVLVSYIIDIDYRQREGQQKKKNGISYQLLSSW